MKRKFDEMADLKVNALLTLQDCVVIVHCLKICRTDICREGSQLLEVIDSNIMYFERLLGGVKHD